MLHELGQPLHAFDLTKISGNKIEVKTCAAGTKFTTLDDIERELHQEDLMICDGEKPMCIAGVFGGNHSGVSEATTGIFLESAYFNPVSVRRTAKRHGLNTDASFRFERGIDPNITEYALIRAALLIQEVAGGEITSDIVDIYPKKIEDHQVFLNFCNATKLIGEELPKEVIKSILTSLDIKINNVTESGIGMTIPAYRNDVTREADVIEELLRVYGYNNINFGTKLNATVVNVSKYEDYNVQHRIANQLTGQGFYEIMANSLTNANYTEYVDHLNTDHNIPMLNPLSNDLGVMRQSMIFSGLEAIRHNHNHKRFDLKFFEFGKTYHQFKEDHREEHKHLTLFITGQQLPESWIADQKPVDFFYCKGIVQAITERLGLNNLQTKTATETIFTEGITLGLGKKAIVTFGSVDAALLKRFDIAQAVYYVGFNWDTVLTVISKKAMKYAAISKYPEVRRDFALLVDQNVTFDQIQRIAKQTEKQLLKTIDLFDVYQGEHLPDNKKSYAVRFVFQDENKTFTDKQVDKVMNKLQYRFEQELGASLR